MPTPLLKVFDDLEAADAARHELIKAGWLPAAIQLRVLEDEAGPVEGNFLVGNGRAARGAQRPSPAPLNHPPDYELNFARVVWRGVCLLVVDVADDGESARRCTELLQRSGPA
jgi:hypothetical protein